MVRRNYIRNPDFSVVSHPNGVHMESVAAAIAPAWHAGPGQGGICDVTFPPMPMANLATWGFKRNPLRYAEFNWSVAPIASDNDAAHGMPRPNGGWTFLEHPFWGDFDVFGKTLNYYFRAVCLPDKPQCMITPLFQFNRKNGDYTLYPQQTAHITSSQWHTVYGSFAFPQFSASDVIDNSVYAGFHLAIDGLCAPHIALVDFAVWRGGTIDEVETRPHPLEMLISGA